MLQNCPYNLHSQLVQEHKSLWRIKNYYLADAERCQDCSGECRSFWEELAQEKEDRIEEIKELLKVH
ncbi:MAG: hypothetical protein Q8P70_02100 [bacterium]|nr:hypothetical protein [bacterium]